jgi:hypothetical protein
VHPLNLGRTALHSAAAAGAAAAVTALLELDADPVFRDAKKQTPYDVSRDKETRLAFRRCDSSEDARVFGPHQANRRVRQVRGLAS